MIDFAHHCSVLADDRKEYGGYSLSSEDAAQIMCTAQPNIGKDDPGDGGSDPTTFNPKA
jgi:hypothetical protein